MQDINDEVRKMTNENVIATARKAGIQVREARLGFETVMIVTLSQLKDFAAYVKLEANNG